jgi:hypothetical protein
MQNAGIPATIPAAMRLLSSIKTTAVTALIPAIASPTKIISRDIENIQTKSMTVDPTDQRITMPIQAGTALISTLHCAQRPEFFSAALRRISAPQSVHETRALM